MVTSFTDLWDGDAENLIYLVLLGLMPGPLYLLLYLTPIISFILPGFNMVCTFHVARVIFVSLVLFQPSSLNLSSFSLCWTFVTISFLLCRVVSPMSKSPTWRTRVSLFVWVITLDLSGMGCPTSSICYCQHISRDRVTT